MCNQLKVALFENNLNCDLSKSHYVWEQENYIEKHYKLWLVLQSYKQRKFIIISLPSRSGS